jgi:hypothetical protein
VGKAWGSIGVLRSAGMRFWGASLVWSLGIAVLIGVPAVLIPNALFRSMAPTRWWDFVLWGVTALLSGAVLASRALPGATTCKVEGRAVSSCALTFLAVGCPVCNKIVVSLVGTSGALAYFAPMQPVIGSISVGILALALHRALQRSTDPAGEATASSSRSSEPEAAANSILSPTGASGWFHG